METSPTIGISRAPAPSADVRLVGPEACGVKTKAGKPCGNPPVAGYAHCFAHEPALAEERMQARVKGGLMATHQRVLSINTPRAGLGTEDEARRLLEDTIHEVRTGAITPAIASTVLISAMCRPLMRALNVILVAPDALAPELNVEEQDDVASALLPSGEYVIVVGGTHEERAARVAELRRSATTTQPPTAGPC